MTLKEFTNLNSEEINALTNEEFKTLTLEMFEELFKFVEDTVSYMVLQLSESDKLDIFIDCIPEKIKQ